MPDCVRVFLSLCAHSPLWPLFTEEGRRGGGEREKEKKERKKEKPLVDPWLIRCRPSHMAFHAHPQLGHVLAAIGKRDCGISPSFAAEAYL